MALAVLQQRVAVAPGELARAIPESEGATWAAIATGLRKGYARFSPYGRASAAAMAMRVLDKVAASPAPAEWGNIVGPICDVLAAGLTDAESAVRAAALQELGRIWTWSPGREMVTTGELDYVAAWKESLYSRVARALSDRDAAVRARAVACLAALPLDGKAAPAVACLKDENFQVRLSVLDGFGQRRGLLDEEAILPLLYDRSAAVAAAAEAALAQRGLSADQVGLCKLVVHPMPHMRASAIPLLQTRTDIDPIVWLVFLSRDCDESVRAKVVEALARSQSVEARRRLAEMAANDDSPSVRQAAAKVAPSSEPETTASLTPLPGSASLNPKAN
jgi:HEAT repeat protein